MRRRYGAGPVHLLAHLAALALVAWGLLQIVELRTAPRVLLWLAASAVVHDFLLVPLYSTLDRAERLVARGPAVNYVRVPAALSLLLGLVFFGVISGRGEGAYRNVSTLTYEGALERWLLVCAGLFLVSAALFTVRARAEAGRRAPRRPRPAR